MCHRFTLRLALLSMLLTLGAGCNVKWSYSGSSGQSMRTSSSGDGITVKTWNDGTRTEVRSKGRVELSSDDRTVVSVASGGFLQILHEAPEGTREVEVRPDASGEPDVVYRVDGTPAELDAAGRDWFAGMLEFVVRETPIAAAPRAERILRESGPRGLLDELKRLNRPSAQEIYFDVLLAGSENDSELLSSAARAAGNHVTSNSALRDILAEIARRQPGDEELSLAIVEASKAIRSNSKREELLKEFARHRSMTRTVALAAIGSAGTIDSNAKKRAALGEIISASPAESDVLLAYVEAAKSISSSNHLGEALLTLLRKSDIETEVAIQVAKAVEKISSSSTQREVLLELVRTAPGDPRVLEACLATVAKMSSVSSQKAVMRALLRRPDLDKATVRGAADVIQSIRSTGAREELQLLVDDRLGKAK